MNASVVVLIMLVCVFGSTVFGLWLQKALPQGHLTADTKDVVKLATALVVTIAALVLSLLVSSAKNAFDRFDDELTQNAARVVMLDRTLEEYGPQASEIRAALKAGLESRINLLFSGATDANEKVDGPLAVTQQETIDTELLALVAVGPVQQGLQAQALALNGEINMTNALIHAQRDDSLPVVLLLVLGLWLMVIFATFGLFAPRNPVAVVTLLLCALSVSGAVLLMLEMSSPFNGLITLSKAPLQQALLHIGH